MDGLLQLPTASPINEQPTTNERVAGRHGRTRRTGRTCGYDASLGQRKRVAHIPTVGAEKGEESGLKILTNRKRRVRAGASTPKFRWPRVPSMGSSSVRRMTFPISSLLTAASGQPRQA